MVRLTAPYNFVPLNHKVVFPDWSGEVSMDVPFEDGICGSFDIELEAETPLIVGGRTEAPPDGQDAPSYKHRASLFDRDVIPGTSIKGMLRAVVEIATFGKLVPRMDARRFAVRDLQNAALYTRHMTDMFKPLSRAGWLRIDHASGGWVVQPCDYSVVKQKTLEAWHRQQRAGACPIYLGKAKATSEDKYRWWGRAPLDVPFTPDAWRAREDWARDRVISRADDVGTGGTTGRIVFTGQPQDRKNKKNAKNTEFLFHSPADDTIAVLEGVRDDFEDIHRDPNTKKPLSEWAFWRPRLLKGERVPVFYLPTASGDGIRAMGLAMMFRLAYNKDTTQLVPTEHQAAEPDFAEALFGFVRMEKEASEEQALRGRVQVEPAAVTRRVAEEAEHEEILLAPKPNYYPAYVAQRHLQKGVPEPRVAQGTYFSGGEDRPYNAYTTYMDDDAELRGRKRYPVSHDIRKSPPPTLKDGRVVEGASRKVYTRFRPHGTGTRFRTTIHVHNLQPRELGALLWAITFGGNDGTHRHSLGMAKPLGYGCVKATIVPASLDLDCVDGRQWYGPEGATVLEECLEEFQAYMREQVEGWDESPQVRHLLAMADPDLGDRLVEAGALATMEGPQPFQQAKKEGLVLAPVLDDPQAWPKQLPPPRVGGGEQSRGGAPPHRTGSAARRPVPRARTGTLDGEAVEILSVESGNAQVRFEDGSIEFVPTDEVEMA